MACFVDPHRATLAVAEAYAGLKAADKKPTLPLEERRLYKLKALPAVGTGKSHEGYTAASVRLRIQGGDMRFGLADTGASICLIDASLVKDLKGVTVHEEAIRLQGIGRSKTVGYVVLDITLPARDKDGLCTVELRHEFYLVDGLSSGVILGADLLDGHDVTLQLRRNRAIFAAGPWIQLFKLKSQKVQAAKRMVLSSLKDVVIPAGTSAWVQFHQTDKTRSAKELRVELALWGDESQDSWFLCERCLIRAADGMVKVTNVGTNHAVVYANMPFAQAEPLEGQQIVPAGVHHVYAPSHASAFNCTSEPLVDSRPTEPPRPGIDKSEKVDGVFNVGLDSTGKPWQPIVDLLRRSKAAFSLDGKPGHVRYPGMRIPVLDPDKLSSEPPRRAPPEKRRAIDDIVDELMELGVIEESNSSASYPLHLVRRSVLDKWRMCVDYRKLNDVTLSDRYPLARADDIFDTLKGATIFLALDAVKGYHQLDVHEDDRWKTAFVCHRGLFQYRRVPFGLKGAPAHFQRFMDGLLGQLRWQSAMVYLDDVVVYSTSIEDHVASLQTLLASAIDVGLKFDPRKCHFALSSLKLLGRLISPEGISILPDRAATIRALQRPKTYGELSATLGFLNYYRHFLPRFAERSAPLQNLLKGARYGDGPPGQKPIILPDGRRGNPHSLELPWNQELEACLEDLKQGLIEALTLAFPDYDKP